MTDLAAAPVRPAYADVETWGAISGLSRRVTYQLLGTGELHAVKRGKSLLIDVDRGLAYLRNLPPAKIKPPRGRAAENRAA